MLITFLMITNIILAIILIVLVLLQQGKGSDLGSAFGGGSSNSLFGAVGPSNFLGKITTYIAALFLVVSLGHAYFLKQSNTEVLFDIDELTQEEVILEEVPTEWHLNKFNLRITSYDLKAWCRRRDLNPHEH